MPTKQRLAEIALGLDLLIAVAVAAGLVYTGLTWWRSRRHTTRWHICVAKWKAVPHMPYTTELEHSELVWETTLPPEEAINHMPMIGSQLGDYIVETVYSER